VDDFMCTQLHAGGHVVVLSLGDGVLHGEHIVECIWPL
jgi:hypothetical protein